MIMEKIIKQAKEGGYNGSYKHWEMVFLDPLFWEALGKTKNWKWNLEKDFGKNDNIHLNYAIAFYEKNLTEGINKALEWLNKQ